MASPVAEEPKAKKAKVESKDTSMDIDEEKKVSNNNNIEKHNYDYDMIVIGGGSGGIACAKKAAELGAKVALFDYVTPTPHGTKWGLGGTCVNVGCIPKKMMHYCGLLHASFYDAKELGWEFNKPKFSWDKMIETVNNYVRSLNWGYKVQLKQQNIKYIKAYASFVDKNTIKYTHKKKDATVTGKYIVLAMGGRPYIPNIPGKELAITSDDIFWQQKEPGKTLCVGGSYIALETAGFLHEMGYDVTVCVRSILLRGFDRDSVKVINNYMEAIGMKFRYKMIPTKLEKMDNGKIKVTFEYKTDEAKKENKYTLTEEFDTVFYATGRRPETKKISLDKAGVEVDEDSGKIRVSNEQTNVSNIFAIGDVVYDGLELTPVAIQAGRLLSKRLFSKKKVNMDYTNVPTTVFTPIEYSCCGYEESEANDVYGEEDLEIYHMKNNPLETYSVHRKDFKGKEMNNTMYFKIICVKSENEKIVGIHYVGPNAGEVMQGFALAMRLGATKEDLDDLVGIHPTCAEWFTTLSVTKASGETAEATAC